MLTASANSANEYQKEKRAQHAVPVCNICFQPIRLFNVRSLKLIYGDIFKAVQQGVHFAECNGSALCHAMNGIFGDYALDLQSSFYHNSRELPRSILRFVQATGLPSVFMKEWDLQKTGSARNIIRIPWKMLCL